LAIIVKHDEGRVAAQLERELLDVFRALAHQQLADSRGAREAQLAHVGVGGQLTANGLRVARDDGEQTRRHTRTRGQLGKGQRGVRRLQRGLDHHRAPCGQRRAHLARHHRDREIPRRDGGRHTDRLLGDDDAAIALRRGNRVAVHAASFFRKPLDERRGVSDLAGGFGQRLALFGREDGSEILLVVHHQVGQAAQDLRTLARRHLAPGALRNLCSLDGAARFGCAHARHGADLAAGGGVGHVARGAIIGIGPRAGKKRLRAPQARVFERDRCCGCARQISAGHAVSPPLRVAGWQGPLRTPRLQS
jgi:hypothetical protein